MAIETPARIAVVGAGPLGLETALYARYLGYDVDLYERGRVAEHVLRWGHVRMFTPFERLRSPLGLAALTAQDPAWKPPAEDALLTGQEWAQHYLIPLSQSDLLIDGLHEQSEVLSIGREGLLQGELVGDEARGDHDFRILLRSTAPGDRGREWIATADVVIDTSGVYAQHNWLGQGGIPALGELAAQAQIEYGLPDVLGDQRDRYAGRNILLLGAGDSAATNLVALAELASQSPDTWITWVTRGETEQQSPQPMAVIPQDPLPERVRLACAANRLAASDANHVSWWGGTTVEAVVWHADLNRFSVRLLGKHAGELECDRILANVGFRGDPRIYGELQVDACHATGGPAKMAAVVAGQTGSDGPDRPPCDPQSLVTPEPDFYILGAKSYGRDSRFLVSTGLEQIRALFTILGDRADLNLYASMSGLY